MNVLLFLISQFNANKTSNCNPVRLDKKETKTSFENFCDVIAPYVLLFALLTMMILILIILVKYGANITGTEQNAYYYHNNV